MIDIAAIATAVTAVVSPFMPFLFQEAGKFTDAFVQKGGEAAWGKAQELWGKITGHLGNDAAVNGAAAVVADDPEDEDAQKQLAKLLAKRLDTNLDLARELQMALGGPDRIQEVIAGNEGRIEYVRQSMKGAGKQHIQVGEKGVISGVNQEQTD